MKEVDEETSELIDSYLISAHAAKCDYIMWHLKGDYVSHKYYKSYEEWSEYKDKLLKKLEETGPVLRNGIEWSVKTVTEGITKLLEI